MFSCMHCKWNTNEQGENGECREQRKNKISNWKIFSLQMLLVNFCFLPFERVGLLNGVVAYVCSVDIVNVWATRNKEKSTTFGVCVCDCAQHKTNRLHFRCSSAFVSNATFFHSPYVFVLIGFWGNRSTHTDCMSLVQDEEVYWREKEAAKEKQWVKRRNGKLCRKLKKEENTWMRLASSFWHTAYSK